VHLEAVVRNGAFPGGSRNRDEANCSLRHGGVVMETVVQVAQGQLQGSVENGLHILREFRLRLPLMEQTVFVPHSHANHGRVSAMQRKSD